MITPTFPPDEKERLSVLRKLSILDTAPEERFDRITRLASHLLGVPIALVSLIDEERQWFKSRVGLNATQTSREISFCGHAILGDTTFQVSDALADDRFRDNPLVTNDPSIRFYAGYPLKSVEGYKLGTLCVIDRVPRQLSERQLQSLQDLGMLAEQELRIQEVREAANLLGDSERWLRAILAGTVDAIVTIDSKGVILSVNPAAEKMFGYSSIELIGQNVSCLMPEPHRSGHDSYVSRYLKTGERKILGIGREVVATRKDGSVFPMELAVNEVGDSPKFFVGIMRDVTERYREQSERNRFSRFFSLPMNMICLAGLDGYFKFLSDGWESNLGYTKEELLAKPFEEFIHPDDRERTRHEVEHLARGSPTFTFENRYLCKDGSIKWLLWNAEVVPEENLIYAVARDITLRKNAEQELRESEAKRSQLFNELSRSELRYRELVDSSEGLICTHDLEGVIEMINPAAGRALGYDPAELKGKRLQDLLAPDVQGVFSQYLQRLLKNGKDHGLMNILGKNGNARIWSYRNSLQQRPGAPPFVLGYAQDVTDQIVAERALARSEAKTRALLQAIPDMMFRINKEGDVLEFLAPRENPFGLSAADLMGKKLFQAVPDDLARLALHHVEEALRTRSIQIFEYSLPVSDRIFDFEARIVVSGQDEILAIIRDIRERREAERIKSEFVSIVSHELRTPLTSILGSLELMSGGVLGDISAEMKEMMDIAYFNADRLLHLINDILDIEKIESGRMSLHFQSVDLLELIRKSMVVNQAYGDRFHVRFEMKQSQASTKVHADEDRIMQVLSNLLSNAAKFSPSGGCVEVGMEPRPDGVRVNVTDRGTGIPDELRRRIFQKFAQADSSDSRKKGGTGLGLSISKAIIERHGGRIGFESTPGMGTTFYFDLPVLPGE